ncbi:MAG: 2Fe-2S iron-sulfur cluster-binding protein [Sphingorhabdus sp.]
MREQAINISFITYDGQKTDVTGVTGESVMRTAKGAGIDGIVADCGGCLSCATCHIYIDPDWLEVLPPKDEMEESVLEMAVDVQENSRLSCQIELSEALNGLVVHLPKSQF